VRAPLLALASILATLTLSAGASPRGASKHAMTARSSAFGPAALRFGRSIGSPTEGRLVGGMHLDASPYLRVVPAYEGGDVRWGLEPLVAMIERAARAVRQRFAGATVSVGHLSRAGGGDIDRHRSHESGRDADIGFFVRDASGRQLFPSHFVAFRGDGGAVGWPGAYFDDAKNWTLVAAMVSDPEAHVTHVFIAAPLRARLLAYAERTGAPAAVRIRAAEAMQQPRGALPHDDHFHVRIGCPPRMNGCVENPAVRASRPETGIAARGRRGGPTQGGVTTAPKHLPVLPPASPPSGLPAPEQAPAQGDAPRDRDAPPASMVAPIDDVDG
jgi:penicillin-insensitive murein endopeptidase